MLELVQVGCRYLKRTLLFERRKETFRDNNFIVTVHVNVHVKVPYLVVK